MNILITTSRMPFALDEIRKLGRAGHRIIAADTFDEAPGSRSRYAAVSCSLPSPRYETEAFLDAVRSVVIEERVDLILPAFEEALHFAKHRDSVDLGAPVFAPDYETLVTLHDKARFQELATRLGLAVPETVVATNRAELESAIARFPRFFARAAFSRGGVQLFTNTGPLGGAVSIDDVDASPKNPILVQEFIDGEDLCTFMVCHHGRVAAHAAYLHPKEIEHAGGIVFESIHDPSALEAAQVIAEATGYHGQLSFDFMRTASGELYLIECNPRPTAGVIVMPDEMFVEALLTPKPGVSIAPPGARRMYASALLRDMVVHPSCMLEDLAYLFSDAREVYFEKDDLLPGLWQLLSYRKVLEYRKVLDKDQADNTDLMAAYFYDVQYDAPKSRRHPQPARQDAVASTDEEPPPSSTFRPAA